MVSLTHFNGGATMRMVCDVGNLDILSADDAQKTHKTNVPSRIRPVPFLPSPGPAPWTCWAASATITSADPSLPVPPTSYRARQLRGRSVEPEAELHLFYRVNRPACRQGASTPSDPIDRCARRANDIKQTQGSRRTYPDRRPGSDHFKGLEHAPGGRCSRYSSITILSAGRCSTCR
jgi:hypothetical protein